MGIVDSIIEELGGLERTKELLGDPKLQYEQESAYWTKRLGRGVYSDLINYGTITKGVVESISCLPLDQQKEIIRVALNQQESLTKILEDTKDTLLVERD
jgi:hypothetical protein